MFGIEEILAALAAVTTITVSVYGITKILYKIYQSNTCQKSIKFLLSHAKAFLMMREKKIKISFIDKVKSMFHSIYKFFLPF